MGDSRLAKIFFHLRQRLSEEVCMALLNNRAYRGSITLFHREVTLRNGESGSCFARKFRRSNFNDIVSKKFLRILLHSRAGINKIAVAAIHEQKQFL